MTAISSPDKSHSHLLDLIGKKSAAAPLTYAQKVRTKEIEAVRDGIGIQTDRQVASNRKHTGEIESMMAQRVARFGQHGAHALERIQEAVTRRSRIFPIVFEQELEALKIPDDLASSQEETWANQTIATLQEIVSVLEHVQDDEFRAKYDITKKVLGIPEQIAEYEKEMTLLSQGEQPTKRSDHHFFDKIKRDREGARKTGSVRRR